MAKVHSTALPAMQSLIAATASRTAKAILLVFGLPGINLNAWTSQLTTNVGLLLPNELGLYDMGRAPHRTRRRLAQLCVHRHGCLSRRVFAVHVYQPVKRVMELQKKIRGQLEEISAVYQDSATAEVSRCRRRMIII